MSPLASLSATLEACFDQWSPAQLRDAVADRAQLYAAVDAALDNAVANKSAEQQQRSPAEALDEDVERVAAELAPLLITAVTDAESKEVAAQPSEAVHDALAAAFGRPVEEIEEALLGDDAVQAGESFHEWGIEVPALLHCALKPNPKLRPCGGG